jgi:hypothetical protein
MEKESFIKIMDMLQKHSDKVHSLYQYGFDLIEFSDELHVCINILLKQVFGEENYDWINWYLYEKGCNDELKAWDENGNEICKNIDDLYELISYKK